MSVITIVECAVIILILTHFLQSVGGSSFACDLRNGIFDALIIEFGIVNELLLLFIIKMV
jgi:hypothetical protein